MLILNDDLSIYCTRGDCGEISINARINGEPSVFSAGDVLRLKVFEKKGCDTVVMQRDFTIEEKADSFVISLTAADTKIGKVISKPVDYWYEVELNPDTNPQTIIGYDEDGPKVFKLFPEGKDVDGEDIPVVGPKTLKELVDYTLEQAKKSGDFKGEKGDPGDELKKGIGENSIAMKTSVALGENSVALGEHTIAGANVSTIPSSEVKVSISSNENGVTIKFVNPSPIVWICPFRIKCTGYGENDWIYISGEYDPAMGIVIPYDQTPIDISEESIDLTAIESVFSYIAEIEQPTDIQATAVGRKSVAAGDMSYAEGGDTLAAGERSHAEGSRTRAHGFGSHTEGVHTYTSDNAWFSHAEGGLTKALNERAHAEGSETVASGGASHAEGAATRATGNASHSEGHDTDATGIGAHSEGRLTQAIGFAAHAEGLETISQNEATHTEGYKTKATAAYAHAEGQECEATGVAAHAEGVNNKAKGIAAHAEGQNTIANNNRSHAEGLGCQANGDYAHVGGLSSIASQSGSFLHGWELRDSRWYQAVFGLYNEVPSIDRGEQLIVGCGNSSARDNCFVAGNSSALGGKYIKIGKTVITEAQLIKLLALLG